MKKNITIVTGMWDLGRGDISGWANRDFDIYKSRFLELLQIDVPMFIWIPKDLKDLVLSHRKGKLTHIKTIEKEDFVIWNPFFKYIDDIRTSEKWVKKAHWLKESPQYLLEYYNAIMFTKMFMLNDSSIVNPFDTDYFFWLDGGITSTVDSSYFNDKVFSNLLRYVKIHNKFLFMSYPYVDNTEIHGFEREAMANYCEVDFVNYVCRGGFFGGYKNIIHKVNELYYSVMESTLKSGFMGADESLFTILSFKYKDLIHTFKLKDDGLIYVFFDFLIEFNNVSVALYILTYNSPKQVKVLLQSLKEYDINLLYNTDIYLINNSTNNTFDEEYDTLCNTYNITHLKKDKNLGICGGRQYVAEHSDAYGYDFYLFFEDDMAMYVGNSIHCRNGFVRSLDNILKTSIAIMKKEDLDFLKLSFSEFFGDNSKQWSWFNVPDEVRKKIWPDNHNNQVSDNCPYTKFDKISSISSIPYAIGEVYYSNWPQIVSKEGNRKMFLDTVWEHPYEQTWMSYIFQETLKGNIKSGVLLASPIEHNRFDHYPKEERREN